MSFEDLLKSLQKDYLDSLPSKVQKIRAQIGDGDAPALRESFHKLKGTGRTYGFPEVSELAEMVEDICAAQPAQAVTAAGHAVVLLEAIHQSRVDQREYSMHSQTGFMEIRKLLQN